MVNDEVISEEIEMTNYSIGKLMGEDFLSSFDEDELISCYGKVMINKFEIKSAQKTIGLGLYLSPSALNHSCEPNCEVKFEGTKIIVKTNRDLRPNEPPLITYCDLSMDKYQRKHFLELNYYFKCECNKCFEIGLVSGFFLIYLKK